MWKKYLSKVSKQPYLTSITRNSNPTDKPEVDGALILLPPRHQCSVFYGYLKLLKLHRTERSRNKDVRSGNRTQDLLHEGRALTDCAILAPSNLTAIIIIIIIFDTENAPSDFWKNISAILFKFFKNQV